MFRFVFYLIHEFELLLIYQLAISVHMTSGPFPAAPRCLNITASPLVNRAKLQLVITWAGPADGGKSRNILSIYFICLSIHFLNQLYYKRMKFILRYSWRSSRVFYLKKFQVLLLFIRILCIPSRILSGNSSILQRLSNWKLHHRSQWQ